MSESIHPILTVSNLHSHAKVVYCVTRNLIYLELINRYINAIVDNGVQTPFVATIFDCSRVHWDENSSQRVLTITIAVNIHCCVSNLSSFVSNYGLIPSVIFKVPRSSISLQSHFELPTTRKPVLESSKKPIKQ